MEKIIPLSVMLAFFANTSFALPFSIMPQGTLPTTITPGGTTTATYTVKNNTKNQRNNNYVKYLPPNVSIAAGGCGSTFNLASGASCDLNLSISGPVNAKDPDPKHHLFVCFPGGTTCAGTNYPLNVANTSTQPAPKAYVASNVGGGNGKIYLCDTTTDGSLENCAITPTTGSPFAGPGRTTFATTNNIQYAYVADNNTGNRTVYQCSLNTDGSFNLCSATFAPGTQFSNPLQVAFTTSAGTQYAYVTDLQNSAVYQCALNSSGGFTTCASTPAGPQTWAPNSIAFTTVSNIKYAYITDSSNRFVYNCAVNPADGSFNTCNTAATNANFGTGGAPFEITFLTLNGTQYAYLTVPFGDKNVYQCTLQANGAFDVCTKTISSSFALAYSSIAIQNTGGTNYAYISTSGPDTLFKCTMDSIGMLNSCAITPSSGAPWTAGMGSITFN